MIIGEEKNGLRRHWQDCSSDEDFDVKGTSATSLNADRHSTNDADEGPMI
jgi:hypothetical protein